MVTEEVRTALEERLHDLKIDGFSPPAGGEPGRPGSVSISDARKASEDFIILRTTKKSAEEFVSYFRFEVLDTQLLSLPWAAGKPILVIREARKSPDVDSLLSIYDCRGIRRLQLSIDSSQGYQKRAGLELPRA